MSVLSHTALYVGAVWHKRQALRRHAFRYPVFYLLMDLDLLAQPAGLPWCLSANRFNLFSLYEQDYGHGRNTSLKNHILGLAARATPTAQIEKIMMLTMPRVLGYGFNPITIFYCLDKKKQPCAIIYEVHNTFGEEHTYASAVAFNEDKGTISPHTARKSMHVSPFFDMQGTYCFKHTVQDKKLTLSIQYATDTSRRLTACLSASQKKLTARNLVSLFVRIPFVTAQVMAAIHFEALRLWIKKIPFFHKPKPATSPFTLAEQIYDSETENGR